ncbi:MAG: hypothetical protein LBT26_11480 [Clostridiales Family XIII bacterium]|nr:hypothetical protein [Clostridiales Family XIII bacterium]
MSITKSRGCFGQLPFELGASLFNYAMKDEIKNLDEYAATRSPATGRVSFEAIVKAVVENWRGRYYFSV